MPANVIDRARAPIVAMVHHPLCLEAGLSEARARTSFTRFEKAALAKARRIITTSRITADTLVRGLRRAARRASPSPSPAPTRAARAAATNRHAASAGRRLDRAAQGLRSARPRARHAQRPGLAPDHRRRHRPQRRRDTRSRRRHRALAGLAPRIARSPARSARATRRALRDRRRVRHVVALRGLRHGAGRGAWRAACRSSAPPAAPPRTRFPTPPASRSRPATKPLSRMPSARCCATPACAVAWPTRRGRQPRSLPRWEDTAAKIAAVIKELAR